MGRHNRDGRGTDQNGCDWEISYAPDWLSHIKITRLLEHGRQSTMTLFRNPEPPRAAPGKQVRTRMRSEQLGVDVEVVLQHPGTRVTRLSIEAAAPSPHPDEASITLTLHAHEPAGSRQNGS